MSSEFKQHAISLAEFAIFGFGAPLVDALDTGAIRGAVLDVAETEPLPPSSALWNRPNVIVCPRTAGLTVDEDGCLTALFADNLGRLARRGAAVQPRRPNSGY